MKRTATLLILLILIVSLSLAGCVDDGYDTDIAGLRKQIELLQEANKDQLEANKKLQDALDSKATTGSISDLKKEVDDIKAKGTGTTVDLSNYYTKTEVNNKINELKNDQSWITATNNPSNPSNPDTTTGTVTFTTNPTSIQLLGNGQICYTMKIVNGTGQWQYVKPIITMTSPTSTTVGTTATTGLPVINITYSATSITYTNMTQSPPATSTNAATGTPTASLVFIPITGGNSNLGEFQVSSGATAEFLICIQLPVTGVTAQWTITNSISNRGI